MELIDPYLEPLERTFTLSLSAKLQESQNVARRVLKGEGWGSQQATEMILNNLMYLTIKFGNEHAEILEVIWSGLTSYWPNNLRVILRYLMAKRIVLYIAHATPERLVEELMNELQTIDIFRFPIERCELPPFYRWVRRPDFGSSVEDRCRGLIHTRRHTPSENEPNLVAENIPEMDSILNPAISMTSLVTLTAENLNEKSNQIVQNTILENVEQKIDSPLRRKEFVIPFQLPLPAYGGHYCPMSEYIPPSNQPLIMLHRSTLAIVFVSDLIVSDAEIEWTVHMPLLLHLSILGLDNNKQLVNDHCRQLLINLLIINSQHCSKTKDVALVLLSRSLGSQLSLQSRGYSTDGGLSTSFVKTFGSQCPENNCICLSARKHLALWAYEDVTARNWRIPSAEHLSNFVSHVVLRALHVPLTSRMLFDILSRLVETVAETSEDIQGYVTEIMLTMEANVLQMEVAEHSLVSLFKGNLNLNEDSTMNNSQNSPTHHRSVSHSVAISKKTPDKKDWRSSVNSIDENIAVNIPRSKSAHAFKAMLDANGVSSGQDEHVVALSQLLWMAVSIMESDYEHEYLLALRLFEKLIDLNATERQDVFDRFDRMVKQLNWVTFPGILPLILKGCSFPNTYESTVSILNKLLPLLLEWPVLSSTNQNRSSNADFALCVTALMPYMLLHFDDPTKICIEAAENIAEICVTEFERLTVQNQQYSSQTQSVANVPEHPLQLLAIIMRQYARRTFSKDCFQWTKCVILYLNDIHTNSATTLLIFLTECAILDKGPPVLCSAVLQIMFCVFQHVDISPIDISSTIINGDFLKIVSRHVQGPNWREASRILKLAVTRSSTFAVPSSIVENSQLEHDIHRKELPGRTMEFRLDVTNLISTVGKEVISAGSLDGSPRKSFSSGNLEGTIKRSPSSSANCVNQSLFREIAGGITFQAKVREHLLGLLNASGLRVGLPKSPSVIFSQSSHDHLAYIGSELPSSVYSSSGELTAIGDRPTTPSAESIGAVTGPTARNDDETSENYAPVFKEFDFLEGEQDSMSETADSCFNWLSTIRPHSISSVAIDKDEKMSRKSSRALVVSGSEGDILNSVDRDLAHRSPSESSDEELEESVSSQADEESIENVPPSEPDQFAGESIAEERVPTPASLSLCGSVGTPSMVDLSSHHFPPFNLECTHHATGQIDEMWTMSISHVSNDADGTATSASTLIFGQLYREACSKMCSLVRDACHFLSMTQIFREISTQFSDALHTLMRVADCPFVFTTSQTLTSSNMLQRQKYYLLELREHYETFQEKRQQTIKSLNSVKSSMKLQLMDQRFEENSTAELASNLTPELQVLQREILRAINDLGSASNVEHPPPHDLPGSGQQRLINLLQMKDFRHAILQLRSLRSHHDRNNDYYGCCEEVDVEILLLFYCKLIAETRYCYAVIGSESQLSENCTSLMESNLNLSTSVRSLNELIKNRASTVDLSSES
uniref:Protein furry n=1 Tax=Romanomermis culicivorax TaxID=13658 RepID=A0A915J263_ROMCU